MYFKYTVIIITAIVLILFKSLPKNEAATNNASPDTVQFNVIPPGNAGTIGGSSFLGPLSNAQRTIQFLIHESILTSLVGRDITGITYRLLPSATISWPSATTVYTNYDIYLSGSVAPADRSLTFSQNIVGTQKLVRFGGLTLDTGAFPAGGSPTQFGKNISFDSTYHYTGGHLLIEVRHTVSNGTSTSNDALSTSSSGYGTLFSSCWTGNYTGTSGSQGNFVVLRLSSDVLVEVGNETEIPYISSLSQNYPNPFNPSTTIKFSLPKQSIVKMVIFDVFGKEVQTLVNGNLNAGNHEVMWDASGFASGVYFYKIITNDFVDVKKMTLIK
ncbi:MAG: T9SS C-terminal target domain-containing protein [Ignavibacteriae bacterium]|nr:MAG: T9SS C-terminal target domain-containing protein [Ignavibacteriota bacterium]